MSTIWIIFQTYIGFNMVIPFLLFVMSIFSKRRRGETIVNNVLPDYAVIVTAFEQTAMLESVIQSILKLKYTKYHIYVVADNCDLSKLAITHSKLTILRPQEVLASNIRSHFFAIRHFIREHDALTIIDSDNLVHPDYLNELNKFFALGFAAIQGKREPKNLDTNLARLDAARDNYYDYYDGKLLFQLGSSATLSGSGMAFKTSLYKECLQNIKINGAGFDKVLQAQLLRKRYRIAHAPKAIVYDQKSSHKAQLVSQRSRWINTWFKYVRYGVELSFRGIVNTSWNQFLFGIILVRPPLFLFLILGFICALVNTIIAPPLVLAWAFFFIIFAMAFLIALRAQDTKADIYKALFSAPKFIGLQLVSLFYIGSANRRSIATKHVPVNPVDSNSIS